MNKKFYSDKPTKSFECPYCGNYLKVDWIDQVGYCLKCEEEFFIRITLDREISKDRKNIFQRIISDVKNLDLDNFVITNKFRWFISLFVSIFVLVYLLLKIFAL